MFRAVSILLALVAVVTVIGSANPVALDASSPTKTNLVTRDELPILCDAKIGADDFALSGRFRIDFAFTPKEDIDGRYLVRVSVVHGGEVVLRRNHQPRPPTRTWKKDVVVRYAISATLPAHIEIDEGESIEIFVGFQDASDRKTHVPDGRDGAEIDGLAFITRFDAPALIAGDAEATEHVMDEARAKARSGDGGLGWAMLEAAFRRTEDYAVKTKLRDVLFEIGKFAPEAITPEEEGIVAARIAAERRRYLRQVAGRLSDRKHFHAALKIIEDIGGSLQEEGDRAVIGALNDAARAEKDAHEIRQSLLEDASRPHDGEASADIDRLDRTKKLLDLAEAAVAKKRLGYARILFRALRVADEDAVRRKAYTRLQEVEKLIVDDIPPEQVREVDAAVNHPAWERTTSVATHKFVFIGPQTLIAGIDAKSKLRFDVASIYITDLFGRIPNPGGDRVTVYFKELWDFGGGVGGGKTIDIGRANPHVARTRVDTGLFFHEFTHCVDDTNPTLAGWREGLADFGAAFALAGIGDVRAANRDVKEYADAFKADYLDRDLEYWRIPNYAPSAGFFFHFLTGPKKRLANYDWVLYRRFFRDYRRVRTKDGREPTMVRPFAAVMIKHFGESVLGDLIRFRFPLAQDDLGALTEEFDLYEAVGRTGPSESDSEAFEDLENSPVKRDARNGRLARIGRRHGEEASLYSEEVGVLRDWQVIGPFSKDGVDPDACIFPPEYEIDFTKTYEGRSNICRWRLPHSKNPPVSIGPTGWVKLDFSYQDNTAFYGLCHVTVAEAMRTTFHLRADDDMSLFLNDELVGKYRTRGRNASAWVGWRGPQAKVPDAMRFDVRLRAGRNKVLVKIKNRAGGAGFVVALTTPTGEIIDDLEVDTDLPTKVTADGKKPKKPGWKRVARLRFDSRSAASKLDARVGGFRVRQKRLVGTSTDGRVAWRKYTVRPGFPKDSPSNLGWLKPKATKKIESFRLELDLESRDERPKIALMFQSEGGTDGLSGWTLIMHPSGRDRITARLERYDRLVYQQIVEPPTVDGDSIPLVLEVLDAKCTVRLGDRMIFDRRPIRPIPGRTRIGIATWGARPALRSLELSKPKR